MIRCFVEISGESPALARAEVAAAARALGGAADLATDRFAGTGRLVPVDLRGPEEVASLGARLALAHRLFLPVDPEANLIDAAHSAGASGRSAAFRRIGRPSGSADARVREAGAAFVAGGGRIDLERPDRRFWIPADAPAGPALLEEVWAVDRRRFAARAMPHLPFRRPVSLAPRLARAAVNLAEIGPGDRVLDPFVGTGALLAEAALLGARVYGIDADPKMIRGALANFAHLGVSAEALVQGDAREVGIGDEAPAFDAVVTDPPYGRSSALGGAEPAALCREVLGRWAPSVRGRVVVVVPGAPPVLEAPWSAQLNVPVRVHRSLTREFRVYARTEP